AGRALPALVVEGAHRRDRRAVGRVLALPDHLVQGLAVDRQLERLAHARVVGERRADVPGGRGRLPVFVPQVDAEPGPTNPRHAGDVELRLLAEARRVRRVDQVHEVDVARAEVGE